ncbi:carbohydrate kinase family protein [Candidatus Vallotiella sp. (ex Adelges kitamiensis)]|uniref:carbohydrate kinase family protein n=1 Tax=Candidatus Vallotiella sp. (ex Adelges kitamiensis) TaxID=2864217 RepID=UPI001CE252F2|nr:carbohydrate kinase family protein [Candidatus Vallotia sp. (ex Adelges kitamiensis)]
MATLICGSLAYDNIMTFEGHFREHILPDQIHILNVSFLVPSMHREFGGCAGNIAYGLKLLGSDPLIMATVGAIDAQNYLDRLDSLSIRRECVRVLPDTHTAQAMITTDQENNQITVFHPGAMLLSHLNHISDAQNVTLGIVAPDSAQGMYEHAKQFAQANIPFMFDPSQGLPILDCAQLCQIIELATYVSVNAFEAKLLSKKTGWSITDIAQRVDAMIITRGAQGAVIYHCDSVETIPVVPAERIVEPTGCGDAFRSGLLYGIEKGLDWSTTGRLASLMGSIKIAYQGPQTYTLNRTEIIDRFEAAFDYRIA